MDRPHLPPALKLLGLVRKQTIHFAKITTIKNKSQSDTVVHSKHKQSVACGLLTDACGGSDPYSKYTSNLTSLLLWIFVLMPGPFLRVFSKSAAILGCLKIYDRIVLLR